MKLSNTFWSNEEVTEKIRKEIKIPQNKWQWKHNKPKPMGCSKSSSKREIYSNKILPQEKRKKLSRQPKSIPKAAGNGRTKTPQISKRKEIIKIWVERKRNERNNSKE